MKPNKNMLWWCSNTADTKKNIMEYILTVELSALGDPIEVPLLNHQNVAENASAYCRKTWTQISVALNCSSMDHTDIFCLLFWMKKRSHLGQIKSYYYDASIISSPRHHVENPNRILPSRQHSVLLEQLTLHRRSTKLFWHGKLCKRSH